MDVLTIKFHAGVNDLKTFQRNVSVIWPIEGTLSRVYLNIFSDVPIDNF